MMILKNKLCGSAARLGRGFQTRPVYTHARTHAHTHIHARYVCVVEGKYSNLPSQESNPGHWIYKQTLYNVAVKPVVHGCVHVCECVPGIHLGGAFNKGSPKTCDGIKHVTS